LRAIPAQAPPVAPGQSSGAAILVDCFNAALKSVDARTCVRHALAREALEGRWQVIAIGKAAGAMTMGAYDFLEDRLASAMVITKAGHCPPDLARVAGVRLLLSAHPQPDERSLEAGRELESLVRGESRGTQILFLISGGASSLVEVLREGVNLTDLQRVNAWALASGRPIEEVNAIRCCLSRVKGGGLGAWAKGRRSLALMISDVAGDDPSVIGSGMLHGRGVRSGLPDGLPGWLISLLERVGPGRDQRDSSEPIVFRIVGSSQLACQGAGHRARDRGLRVRYGAGPFSGDAAMLGRHFARDAVGAEPGTVLVWGGESTVALPVRPGRGGRNQHLALSAAMELAGRTGVWLLAAGTDGVDGMSEDAGAVVDGTTIDRGTLAGFDAGASLAAANSGTFLEASGDLLHTGPTLTNVGDLVLALNLGFSR
jgi:hydroxypyruvate reductase